MSNNLLGTQTRNELGLSLTAPGAVTSYTHEVITEGAPFPLPFLITDGTDGNDVIQSNQTLVFGMDGDDTIEGGQLSSMFGGLGNDTFKLASGGLGQNTTYTAVILDFEQGDRIDFSGSGYSFSDLNISVNQNDTFALITSDDSLVSVGITSLFDLNSLSESSFIFGDSSDNDERNDSNDDANQNPIIDFLNRIEFNGRELPDLLEGNDLANVILGKSGRDTIDGGRGNDTVNGNADADNIFGGLGFDFVRGGKGNDFVNGNANADRVFGDLNDDTVRGGKGNDTVRGGKDNDQVFGDNDYDLVYGDKGDDVVHGGKLNDTVSGGEGNDSIYGDRGDDLLNGGDGFDAFYFRADSGVDVIEDFIQGQDILRIDNSIFASIAEALAAFEATEVDSSLNERLIRRGRAPENEDGILDLGNGNQITLTNITSLTEADIEII